MDWRGNETFGTSVWTEVGYGLAVLALDAG